MTKTLFEAKTFYGDSCLFFIEDIVYVKFVEAAPTHYPQIIVKLTSEKVALVLDCSYEEALRKAMQQR